MSLSRAVERHLRDRALGTAIDVIDREVERRQLDDQTQHLALRITEEPSGAITAEMDGLAVTYASLAGCIIELACRLRSTT